jgi:NAD(P)H-dependent flavin oxidoreductase YrpB (nitropropane dioxygenase family)
VETAGSNPAKYIDLFKRHDIKVLHKCPSSIRFALKAQELGADAVSIHGFECGGHPGEDDIPGLVLIPAAADKIKLPILSSGGVADGRGLAAVICLGAEGAVMGTRFMLTKESPLNSNVKARMLEATERDTRVVGRSVHDSSRVLHNKLVDQVLELEKRGDMDYAGLFPMIGAERWIAAAERGDADDGAYPVGLAVGLVHDIPSVAELVDRIMSETVETLRRGAARVS